jgi:hypothetical protein
VLCRAGDAVCLVAAAVDGPWGEQVSGGCSSAGRAAALQAVGSGFESCHLHHEWCAVVVCLCWVCGLGGRRFLSASADVVKNLLLSEQATPKPLVRCHCWLRLVVRSGSLGVDWVRPIDWLFFNNS